MKKVFMTLQQYSRQFMTVAFMLGLCVCGNEQNAVQASNLPSVVVEQDDAPQASDDDKAANLEEVQAFLKEAKTFYVATVEGDQPRVRPFGVSEIINGKLYIMTGKKKENFKQIMKNGKVEICALKGGSEWIRISGTLVSDDSRAVKETFLERQPGLKGMYSADDDNMAVLYFTNGEACFNSFGGAARKVAF